MRFAAHAHQGVKVPGSDLPYIIHSVLVCMEVMAALLTASELDGDLAMQCVLNPKGTPSEAQSTRGCAMQLKQPATFENKSKKILLKLIQ